MSDYAVSKLITAMGMFIHDLWAMRGDSEGPYVETAYYDLAIEIQRGCDLPAIIQASEGDEYGTAY